MILTREKTNILTAFVYGNSGHNHNLTKPAAH
jgi:hypothetical protein